VGVHPFNLFPFRVSQTTPTSLQKWLAYVRLTLRFLCPFTGGGHWPISLFGLHMFWFFSIFGIDISLRPALDPCIPVSLFLSHTQIGQVRPGYSSNPLSWFGPDRFLPPQSLPPCVGGIAPKCNPQDFTEGQVPVPSLALRSFPPPTPTQEKPFTSVPPRQPLLVLKGGSSSLPPRIYPLCNKLLCSALPLPLLSVF